MADTDTSMKEPPTSENDGASRRGKSRRKLLIIAVSLVALLAAAGGGAFYMLMPAADEGDATIEPAVKPSTKFAYLELDPFVIRAIDAAGSPQYVTLIISLEVDDGRTALGHFERMKPRVHDAILRGLHRPLMQFGPDEAKLPIAEVKRRVAAASAEVLGQDVVNDVLMRGEL